MSRINETLKQKIDELDLDTRLDQAAVAAEGLLAKALETAGTFAHDHRDDIERWTVKAETLVEERTGGKYADQVARVRDQLTDGVDRLAERRRETGPDDTVG